MEIKVGEYVRNRYGIAKVVGIEKNNGIEVLIFDRNICFLVDKKTGEIKDDRLFNKLALIEGVDVRKTKHSKNIIDLIEVGDYVNGHRIYDISKEYIYAYGLAIPILNKNDIKSIVTKQQFEQNAYRLEEK